MKKLSLLSIVFVLLSFININTPSFYNIKNCYANANYSFYVADDIKFSNNYTEIENAGLGNIVTCNAQICNIVKKDLSNIVGESITFEGTTRDVINLLDIYNASVVKTEHINEDILCVYASTSKFKNSILIDNQKINLQIAYSNGRVTMGTPIILGSY